MPCSLKFFILYGNKNSRCLEMFPCNLKQKTSLAVFVFVVWKNIPCSFEKIFLAVFVVFFFSLERRRLEFSQRHLLHRLSLPLWPLLGFLLIDFQHRVQKRLMKCNVIDRSHNMMGWQRTGILFFDHISIRRMVQTSFCAASFYA